MFELLKFFFLWFFLALIFFKVKFWFNQETGEWYKYFTDLSFLIFRKGQQEINKSLLIMSFVIFALYTLLIGLISFVIVYIYGF